MGSGKEKAERKNPLSRLSQERKTKAISAQVEFCIANKGQRSGESLVWLGIATPGQIQIHLAPHLAAFIKLCSYFESKPMLMGNCFH